MKSVQKLLVLIFGGMSLIWGAITLAFWVFRDRVVMRSGTVEGLLAAFASVTLVMLLAACLSALIPAVFRRRTARLLLEGRAVQAVVTGIESLPQVRINGRPALRVHASCRHPFTGEELDVRSPLLTKTGCEPGQTATVYFDPMRDKRWLLVLPGDEKNGSSRKVRLSHSQCHDK